MKVEKMKSSLLYLAALALLLTMNSQANAQSASFNPDLYKQFLESHKTVSAQQLINMHQAGLFQDEIDTQWKSALYSDSMTIKLNLTQDELDLIRKHGFVVTERLNEFSFGQQFLNVYHNDLPVFITTDAILHAFHSSYDLVLKQVELHVLIPALADFLEKMHENLPALAEKYAGNQNMKIMLNDIDVYLTVPRKLLNEAVNPAFSENQALVDQFLADIESETMKMVPVFSETPRRIDFSQFKPRGHYTDTNHPELASYFRTMIWLGRMEIYLLAPQALDLVPTFAEVQRQCIDAVLIKELVDLAGLNGSYDRIEEIIAFFVGKQDNVTLHDVSDLITNVPVISANDLLDSLNVIEFQSYLKQQPYAEQKILSQILMSHPMNPDSLVPASAFLLFGQRFVIDSYVTGNVVFDKIIHEDLRVTRMLPSTLDVMFSMGNDAAGQLLRTEIDEFHYGQNLAGLRYLIDSYDDAFWQSSIYNMWLNGIRGLNPSSMADRGDLPVFMQTAAWWQEKLNTQLGAWTELRHDNLLYAKQSYTGGISCSYPYGYVEPMPEFFGSLRTASGLIKERILDMPFEDQAFATRVSDHFARWQTVMDTLSVIAQKELDGTDFNNEEQDFLASMLREEQMCGGNYDGWYPELFFDRFNYENGLLKVDQLVADYHTAPTDEFGSMVGWVAHAGTGKTNMAIISAQLPSGQNVAFAGPVYSYHEYTSTNFLRLTDQEWKETYLQISARPEWTNIYLADKNGELVGPGPKLLTNLSADPDDPETPKDYLIATNYPNPFNPATFIQFRVPQDLANNRVAVRVFDIKGQKIADLLEDNLPGGVYVVRWDGTGMAGKTVASGIYIYSISVGSEQIAGKMHLIR